MHSVGQNEVSFFFTGILWDVTEKKHKYKKVKKLFINNNVGKYNTSFTSEKNGKKI